MLTLIFSLIGGLVLTSILIFLIYRSLKIKKKINQEIELQRDEIASQRDVLAAQQNRIEDFNRQLVSSINYAERIQRAAVT